MENNGTKLIIHLGRITLAISGLNDYNKVIRGFYNEAMDKDEKFLSDIDWVWNSIKDTVDPQNHKLYYDQTMDAINNKQIWFEIVPTYIEVESTFDRNVDPTDRYLNVIHKLNEYNLVKI